MKKSSNSDIDKRELRTSSEVSEAIDKVAGQIISHFSDANGNLAEFVLVGLHFKGVPMAERLRTAIARLANYNAPLGTLDITMYRDDIGLRPTLPMIQETEMDFDLDGAKVILVDDVLSSGRTIRAALDALTDYGRPEVIRLAVLVDRGMPEFPIRADFSGMLIELPPEEKITTEFNGDGEDRLYSQSWNTKLKNR